MVPPAPEDMVIPITITGHADFQRDAAEPTKAALITQPGDVTDLLSNVDDTLTCEYQEGVHRVPKKPWSAEGPPDYVSLRIL